MSRGYDFKKEEEVKQFIKNIGIEYRYGCYKENNGEACHLLGDYSEAIEKDKEKAVSLYKMNCEDNNFSKSCYKYGMHILRSNSQNLEDTSVLKTANEYFVKGCNMNHYDSCYRAGQTGVSIVQNINPDAPEKDFSMFTDMLEKSCINEVHNSCYYLASFYIQMLNFKKAFDPLVKACDAENPYACANLSIMYKKGHGVEVNKDLENEFKSKAAELFRKVSKDEETLTFQQGLDPV